MSITPTVIPTASVAGIPLPAKDQCILYPFANYQGDPKIFTGYNTYDMSDYAADNAVSSFMCGSEVFAYFCTSPSATVATCQGGGNSTTAGRISNPSLTGSLNDSISTLIMLQYDPKSQPGVTMFDDNDCTGGISAAFQVGPDGGETWFTEDLLELGNMPTDAIGSVKVPYGVTLTLYPLPNLQGTGLVIDGTSAAGAKFASEPSCYQFTSGISNIYSSFKVSFRGSGGAVGSWEPVATGTGSITKDVFTGLSSTNPNDNSSNSFSKKNALDGAMSLGFVYGSQSITDTLKAPNNDSLNYSEITVSGTRTCASDDSKEAVGLWQWVVETNDGVVKAATEQFVCRFGASAQIPPQCPFGACASSDCSKCISTWQKIPYTPSECKKHCKGWEKRYSICEKCPKSN